MFVKITTSGGRRYIQLVESFRDENGRVKKRTVATLGRLDQLQGDLDTVIKGLQKISGIPASPGTDEFSLSFESARAMGDIWALTELWQELGFNPCPSTQLICHGREGIRTQLNFLPAIPI